MPTTCFEYSTDHTYLYLHCISMKQFIMDTMFIFTKINYVILTLLNMCYDYHASVNPSSLPKVRSPQTMV